ncbi:MAG: glycosyltransferase family 4 protein [Alphaproteobacteria bacterium]|nr:glycosyltransferase family 4 protein [Alphaproteobacteria bacterium]
MNVLFVHRNFPGQFPHLAPALAARPGNRVVALGEAGVADPKRCPPGVKLARYRVAAPGKGADIHRFLRGTDAAVRRGEAVARAGAALRKRGFVPDVVVAHTGWGEGLFLRDAFAAARILAYCEFYYHATGADVGFDPEFPAAPDDAMHLRMRNAVQLLSLEAADRGLSPTEWQKSVYPSAFAGKIAVIHDGIDVARVAPDPQARFALPDGTELRPGDPVVTYVARNLEPYRGFHVFMRALPDLLARCPRARVVIVGGEEVSYGRKPAGGGTWRAKLTAELGGALDPARVHFTGSLPYARYLALLQVSAAHVYLTYPFVLSWSMLEAMAAGCTVIGSATAPVKEAIADGRDGVLVDFFDRHALVDAVAWALANPDAARAMGGAARAKVMARYALERCRAAQLSLIDALAAG